MENPVKKVKRSTKKAADKVGKAAGRVGKSARKARSAISRSKTGSGALEDRTKKELYERARELDVEGRSTMSKAQLVRAIRNQQ